MTKIAIILILMFTCLVVKAQGIPQPVQTGVAPLPPAPKGS